MPVLTLKEIFSKKEKVSLAPHIFVGALVFATVLTMGAGICDIALVQKISRVILGISYLALFLNILYNSWYVNVFVDLALIGAVFVLCVIKSGLTVYLTGLIVVVALKDVPFKKVLSACFWGCLAAWSIILLWWMFTGMSDTAHGLALGFNNPNQTGFFISYLYMIALYLTFAGRILHTRDFKRIYIASWVLAVVVLILTQSKTSAISLIVLPVLVHVFSYWMAPGSTKTQSCVVSWVSVLQPFLIFFTYLSAKLYTSSKFIQILDKIFTNRIFLNWWAFNANPLTLFGNKALITSAKGIYNPVRKVGGVTTTVDSAYSVLLLGTGIIPTILYSIVYACSVGRAVKKRDVFVVAFSVIFCLYAFMETLVTAVFINVIFLYLLCEPTESEQMSEHVSTKDI